MDIQGWLQGTTDRASPNPSDEVDAPAFGHPIQGIEATTAIRYRRKRKRAASDSSIIAPQQWPGHRGKADDRSAHAARDLPLDERVSPSNSASRHRRPRSEQHGMDDYAERSAPRTYERRARHKTKPDRYESKKKTTGERKQRDDAGERKSKRKRSKARRGGDGKRTESLVQGFRLKNGPSNSRLTLKPDITAGLFRHGRASAQMAGRRNGLPDLVFNELKFLRDPNEHQDERQPDATHRKPSNQERKRETERKEISTYFHQRTSHDNALDPLPGRQKATKQGSSIGCDEYEENQDGGSSPILPDEELTAIPYLGFGSKGTANQSSHHHHSATTYLTWSESADEPKRQVKRMPGFESSLEIGQLSAANKMQRSKRDPKPRPADVTAERPIHKSPRKVQEDQWTTSRRHRGPAQVEVYIQPSNNEQDFPTSNQKPHDNTSLSLPTKPPVGSAQQRQQRPASRQQGLPSDARSFNTSDILKVRGRLDALVEEAPSSIKNIRAPEIDKENVEPVSSSPTAKILRIAHEAMARTHDEPASRPSRDTKQSHHQVEMIGPRHTSRAPKDSRHRPIRAHRGGQDEEEMTHRPVYMSPAILGHFEHQPVRPNAEAESAAVFDQDDDEILDDHIAFDPHVDEYEDMMAGQGSAYVYVPPATHSDLRSLSYRHDRPSTRARGNPWSRGYMSATMRETTSHIVTAERGSSVEIEQMGGREFEDGLEGFWKPNRLY